MPDTIRIITAASGSRRRANPTLKSPEVIHVKICCDNTRDSGGSASSRHTATSDTANEPAIAAHAAAPAAALLIRRPKLAFSRNPANGNSGMRSSITRNHEDAKTRTCRSLVGAFVLSWPSFLPFQLREHVRVERLAVPEQPDDDGE